MFSKTIIQIYEIKSVEDAQMVVGAGVDHVGVPCGLPRFISFEQAREIFDVVGQKAVKVALTVSSDIDEIIILANSVKPDILHLSGEIEKITPVQILELKQRMNWLKIMQALPANDSKIFQYVREYEAAVDYFLVDTAMSGAVEIGASGLTHDWQIDQQIVQMTRVPCIIAGGLGPENVAEAIKLVRPYGVDSMTKTNLLKPHGNFTKDPDKVRAFVKAVQDADRNF